MGISLSLMRITMDIILKRWVMTRVLIISMLMETITMGITK